MMSAKKTMYGKPPSVMIQFHTENREKVMSAKKTMYGKPPSVMIVFFSLQFMAALCNAHFMPCSRGKFAWLLVLVLPIHLHIAQARGNNHRGEISLKVLQS